VLTYGQGLAMRTFTVPSLAGAKLRRDEIRSPQHRFMLELSGRPFEAWLLKSIDQNNSANRDTLVIPRPHEVLTYLNSGIQSQWTQFQEGLERFRKEWRFHGAPTLKRVVRKNRSGSLFRHINLATVVHHHGAVPVLIVGRVERYQIGLYPEDFGRETVPGHMADNEVLELLNSLSAFLPLMLQAYYEQTAFYLEAIFYTASDEQVMSLCRRIREISKKSIIQKLDSLEKSSAKLIESHRFALQLSKKFEREIREGRAVDAFAHLLVNYIYRFFCISDRVAEYADRLFGIRSEKNLFDADSVGFMQECARNIVRLDDSFLGKVEPLKANRSAWLQKFGQVSALVAEIVKSTDGVPIEKPRVFVTYHFKVKDSEKFVDHLRASVKQAGINVEVVQGRHLGRAVRWSILARIWMCDHHVLFLPGSWIRNDGKLKTLRRELSWVIMELLYGNLLHRDLTLITKEPFKDEILDDFRKQLDEYTEVKEIPYVPQDGWAGSVSVAKKHIADVLHAQRRIGWNQTGQDGSDFCARFVKEILDTTRHRLLEVIFDAWRSFFDSERWSVMQALMELGQQKAKQTCTVRELAKFMRENASRRAEYQWIARYKDQTALERAVRDYHLGSPDNYGTLRQFSFMIAGRTISPLFAEKVLGRLQLSLRIEEAYEAFCQSLHVDDGSAHLENICRRLLD
jgi:hypothetical protein